MVNSKPTKPLDSMPALENSPISPNGALGKLIEYYRIEMKLSLEDLADLTEVSVRDLGLLEEGKCRISLEQLFRISNYINIPPSALLSAIHHEEKP